MMPSMWLHQLVEDMDEHWRANYQPKQREIHRLSNKLDLDNSKHRMVWNKYCETIAAIDRDEQVYDRKLLDELLDALKKEVT